MFQKKKVLLVMPNVMCNWQEWPVPPVGIPYVSAYMKKQGITVYCLNLCLCDEPMKDLEQTIRREQIDIVATGDLVVNYLAVKEIVDCAKRVSPHIITIIGGGLVTHSPEEAMQLIPNADYGVIGEGEETDSELVLTLESGGDPARVAGIIYRDEDALRRTEPRAAIDDLDGLPWPDYEGFHYFEVAKRFSDNGTIAVALTTSRSCPFQCTFCSTSGGEKKYRQRSLDSIFAELEYLVNRYHVKEVFLNDELFAVDGARLHEFCQRITPFHVRWLVFLRLGKHIQLELLREMHDAGCETVFYGLESANDTILKSMKKGTTEKEMLRVLEITKEAGISVRGGFIFGDTMETLETAEYTINWAEQHADLVENVSFAAIRLYPGAELYLRAVRSGRISDPVQHIRDGCPPINSSEQMDDEAYQILIKERIPYFAARFKRQIVLQRRERLKEEIIPEPRERRYLHTFSCQQCGENIVEYLYSESMFQYHTECPNCGQRYDMYPGIVMLQQYESEIFSRISQNGCAIWGAGLGAQDVYCNIARFRDADGLILLDNNQWLQKVGFHGKTVISPELLPELRLNKVFIFAVNVSGAAIKKLLEGTTVRAVGLYEILFED